MDQGGAATPDLVGLLLEWQTDPHDVDLADLFSTYNSKLFERFRALGVDMTSGHALAEALAYHTSNKPLFGFANRHRRSEPRIQAELDSALAYHAGEGNEKGVALCLWAGADPHAPARSLRFGQACSENGDDAEEGRLHSPVTQRGEQVRTPPSHWVAGGTARPRGFIRSCLVGACGKGGAGVGSVGAEEILIWVPE